MRLLTRPMAAAAAATLVLTAAISAITFAQPRPGDAAAAAPVGDTSAAAEDRARRAFATMPLAFEANRGQVDAEVKYLARGQGFTLFLTRHGAVFDLRAPASREGTAKRSAPAAAVLLDPVGASARPRLEGRRHQRATSSYFLGDDRRNWHRGVPTFGRVRYRDLYPGIDMVFRGDRSGAEYDFVVAPGSDPARIGYRLRGADALHLEGGDLIVATAVGDFVHRAPVAYQWVDGERRSVTARFRVVDGVVSFDLGSYDRHRPLVIDPATDVEYGTFLGGDGADGGNAIIVDGGDAYVTGFVVSSDFPTTTGAYDTTRSAQGDAFMARISPDGAGSADLVYSTFFGGDGYRSYYDDEGLDIAVDDGDVYLAGLTHSPDFPTTPGAFDTTFGGDRDGFLARISPDGAGAADLVYATFLGGSGNDTAWGIAAADGSAYLAGMTSSADFPTTAGALDTVLGYGDAFVAQLSTDGAGPADLAYATFLGGSDGSDEAFGLALDAGDVYVTGETSSTDFPTTPGAYDRSANDDRDTFLARISPDGAGAADLVYGTYFGAGRTDSGRAIAVDDGVAFLTGLTTSPGLPTTEDAHDRSYGGAGDAFLARIAPDGAGAADLRYASFLGGGEWDISNDLAVADGDAYVVGTTGRDDRYGGVADVFVARLSPDAAGAADLAYYTELGSYGDDDYGYGIAVDGGTAYVTGSAWDLPTTPGAYDTTPNDLWDAFVVLLDTPDNKVWPDGLVRRGDGPDVGDDVYGKFIDQRVSTRVRKRHERVFWITVQNDDNAADTIMVTGGGTQSTKWRIRYYAGGVNITGRVGGEGYRTPILAPGEEVVIKLTVKPRAAVKVGATKTTAVLLTSLSDPTGLDRVKAEVTVRRG